MEILLGLAAVAAVGVALVALNFALQRLARPDKGDERIAGCCGMALPEELLRTEGVAAIPGTPGTAGAAGRSRATGAADLPAYPQPRTTMNILNADPGEDPREEYHEL